MRRTVNFLALLLLVALAGPARPALAQPAGSAAAAAAAASAGADFDNDGVTDLAVGVPGENDFAGAITVLYGSGGTGLSGSGSQLFMQVAGAVEGGDLFGAALAAGNFNGDAFADLAVGAPGEVAGSAAAAGAVSILYGSALGLTASGGQLFTQVAGAVEEGDRFGSALAAGDFDNDGFADLAVGAPGEVAGSASAAGAVSVLRGSAAGLTATGGRLFTQVAGAVEQGDQFGAALAAGDFDSDDFADLAAGAPGEVAGTAAAAGAVSVLRGSGGGLTATGGQLFTQVGGAVEQGDVFGSSLASGDFNGDTFGDLAAGAPGEVAGSAVAAGALSVLYGSAGGLGAAGGRLFTQVGGAVEQSDLFGWSLAAGNFDGDAFDDLAAGAPGETVGAEPLAGAVSVIRGSGSGLTTAGGRLFTQVGGAVEADDQFGAEVGTGDFDDDAFVDLAVGAPAEDVSGAFNAGAVSALYGTAGGLSTAGGQLFTQNSPGVPGGAEDFDSFGGVFLSAG